MSIARHSPSRAGVSREFSRISAGPYQLYLRTDLAPHAAALATRSVSLAPRVRTGTGNRGGGFRLALPGGPELFVRRSPARRRDALVLDDLYVGLRPRPLSELW